MKAASMEPQNQPLEFSESHESQALNVVLGGGGIKGIGLVGAVAALEDAGYRFNVLAGCSAGAIMAALSASGMKVSRVREVIDETDFLGLLDNQRTGRFASAVNSYSVVRHAAINSGNKVLHWIEELLAEQNVHTFGDLKHHNADSLPMEQRYKLVVSAADITNGRLLRLPWDFPLLDLDPDSQSVAEVIRASIALPFLFKPHEIGGVLLADGGIVMNYPINIFRELLRSGGRTLGVRLSFAAELAQLHPEISNLSSMARAMLITSINAQGEEMMRNEDVRRNTIVIDSGDVRAIDFQINKAKQRQLYLSGYQATQAFLETWEG